MGKVYRQVLEFKRKYPMTVGWRLKRNAAIVEMHLNPEEEPLYTFYGQKNDNVFDFFSTAVITLTVGDGKVYKKVNATVTVLTTIKDFDVEKTLR